MKALILLLFFARPALSVSVCQNFEAVKTLNSKISKVRSQLGSEVPPKLRNKLDQAFRTNKTKTNGRVSPWCGGASGNIRLDTWSTVHEKIGTYIQKVISNCLGGKDNVSDISPGSAASRKIVISSNNGRQVAFDLDFGYMTVSQGENYLNDTARLIVNNAGGCNESVDERARRVTRAKAGKYPTDSPEYRRILDGNMKNFRGGSHVLLGDTNYRDQLKSLPCD